jgi:hypothetical protein
MDRIKVGKPDIDTDDLGHVQGVRQGNARGNYESQDGMLDDGKRTAEASTGVNAEARNPIDPRMPNLPPG